MKFYTVFKAVTKNWLRSRSGLFFSIMFPILLLVVFGAIFSGTGGSSQYSIYIQNLDVDSQGQPTELSTAFITALNSTKTFSMKTIPADANATDYVQEDLGPLGGTMRILIISDGFNSDLLNGTMKVRVGITYDTMNMSYQYFQAYLSDAQKMEFQQGINGMQELNSSLPETTTSLTIITDPSDQSAAVVKSIIGSVTNAFNYQLIGAQNIITINEESATNTTYNIVDYYVPGITAAFIMTNGIIGLSSNSSEFKRRGIIKRLSLTPLTKLDWIIGNVLSQALLNLVLTGIMIGVGWIIFNVTIIPDLLTIIMLFLGSVMFSGIGMTIAGLFKDIEAANAAGNAIAFPMMFLSGTFFPLEMMPSYLQTISKALPLTYFADGLRYSMVYNFPEGVYTNMAVVAVLAVVFILVGALFTRWRER
ncbi:MAG: ABC transporter permease [Candidatus Bathyarchaeia archaeon]|jgi:ABC-2 type transport system permease protein